MNRKTKKKLKQEIKSLKNEVWDLSLRLRMANLFQFCPRPVKVKAIVSMSEYLYPEQAYPTLHISIMQQLETVIDDFIETYRDDIMGNHVAYFQFIPTYSKEIYRKGGD